MTPPNNPTREPIGDAGPSRVGIKDGAPSVGDIGQCRKPPDDEEFWRMMKYEEKRLKEAGRTPWMLVVWSPESTLILSDDSSLLFCYFLHQFVYDEHKYLLLE